MAESNKILANQVGRKNGVLQVIRIVNFYKITGNFLKRAVTGPVAREAVAIDQQYLNHCILGAGSVHQYCAHII